MGTHYQGRPAEVRALEALIKLVRCGAAVQARLTPGIREAGLSPAQFGLLEALLHLGPLEPCELGPKLLTSRPNVILLVDQLEARGLVRRRPVEGDRRRVRIELTSAGARTARSAFARHLRDVVAAFAPLSAADQEQLAALCKRLGLGARHQTPA
jgi:MarR family 2-MHQ and catechol resistance regulon transcriptional repressor